MKVKQNRDVWVTKQTWDLLNTTLQVCKDVRNYIQFNDQYCVKNVLSAGLDATLSDFYEFSFDWIPRDYHGTGELDESKCALSDLVPLGCIVGVESLNADANRKKSIDINDDVQSVLDEVVNRSFIQGSVLTIDRSGCIDCSNSLQFEQSILLGYFISYLVAVYGDGSIDETQLEIAGKVKKKRQQEKPLVFKMIMMPRISLGEAVLSDRLHNQINDVLDGSGLTVWTVTVTTNMIQVSCDAGSVNVMSKHQIYNERLKPSFSKARGCSRTSNGLSIE